MQTTTVGLEGPTPGRQPPALPPFPPRSLRQAAGESRVGSGGPHLACVSPAPGIAPPPQGLGSRCAERSSYSCSCGRRREAVRTNSRAGQGAGAERWGRGSKQQLGEGRAARAGLWKGGDSWVPPTCESLCQAGRLPAYSAWKAPPTPCPCLAGCVTMGKSSNLSEPGPWSRSQGNSCGSAQDCWGMAPAGKGP